MIEEYALSGLTERKMRAACGLRPPEDRYPDTFACTGSARLMTLFDFSFYLSLFFSRSLFLSLSFSLFLSFSLSLSLCVYLLPFYVLLFFFFFGPSDCFFNLVMFCGCVLCM